MLSHKTSIVTAIASIVFTGVVQVSTAQQYKPSQAAVQDGVPKVEAQIKVFTVKLDLTDAQQTRIKPILQKLHDTTKTLMEDQTLSDEERLNKVRTSRQLADKQMREILNDDQKKKLDQLYKEPHQELHGDLHGAKAPAKLP